MPFSGQQVIEVEGIAGIDSLEYKFDYQPTNLCLVCQTCGELWARFIVLGTAPASYTPISHQCRKCGNGRFSNLLLEYRDFRIPDALLLRELEIYYEHKDERTYSGTVYV